MIEFRKSRLSSPISSQVALARRSHTMKTFVPCATWRSTGTYADVFYLESFIEGMPRAARKEIVHDQGHAIVNPEAAERQICA